VVAFKKTLAPSSDTEQPVPASCGKALDFVRHDMALRNKVEDSQVVVVRAELTTWPDGCLGLPPLGLCRLAPVEGCVLVVEANGNQLEYHITLEADSFGIANGEGHAG
jgi:hypothetical protein